jgi:hypothetical protein
MSHRFAESKVSVNIYGIYHCCVYSEKLLMMDRGTVKTSIISFQNKILGN